MLTHPSWPRTRLGDIAKVVNGAAFPSSAFNTDGHGLPLIRIRDVGATAISTWYSGDWEAKYLAQTGAVLVGMDGDFRAARWGLEPGLLNQRVCRIDVDPSRYDESFLLLVVQGYLDAIWEETSSVTVKHLSSRTVQAIPLPDPPLEEQRRIVAILEDHLSHLDAANASIQDAVCQVNAWAGNKIDALLWGSSAPLVSVGSLLREPLRNGRSGRAVREGSVGIRTLTITAVTKNDFSAVNTKVTSTRPEEASDLWLEAGDIFVQRANTPELVGTAARYDGPSDWATFPDLLIRVRAREDVVDSAYLVEAMRSERAHRKLRAKAKGLAGSMPKIDQAAIASWELPLPPMETQQELTIRLLRVAAIRDSMLSSFDLATTRSKALRRSLLAAAFRGDLTATWRADGS